ncbi:MAG TPA: DUF423 domain-containing protein [Nitrosomonas nitrosa]|jgi:uncharacterized membrane protein YgdD (TMEM256/DUF423 family)|uniref:Uncharacterized membrane protein YgdD, TMEM256/DUF423 family n=1 Tax=Nitrosomonas nitrosa TaxID=52442 RepID=A0A1I4MHQ2_9PROT|nr:DUF423 domain-containing protein [Nitrosomonas nitrosa]MCO6435281.1 DUF423 domain-containing protein [Nitrosomonas nitrosa]PTQ91524.1 uncharacterized membrane protein YgdD (TMEM256/DUF423 family) [Nitrosomonas nitrosa]CAE6517294.1 conserved membrane hypothetical protein [Nitrosomonas nitrosa]SFM02972.1 Uncharacterized membrane protein YgdD, TMEM256/DUF423 family [Nitrosomonas nitrosa]HBZ29831.1 DUF423 domain-containing protein [Nitrosomonas nitrosa]
MPRIFLTLGSINAFLCVLLGALGAHGLKHILTSEMLVVFQTAVQYHFYHALGMILVGLVLFHLPQSRTLKLSGWLMFAGIVLFSGTLYAISLTEFRGLSKIAPLGGLSYMSSWILFAYAAWTSK